MSRTASTRRADYKGDDRWPFESELLALGFSVAQVAEVGGFSTATINNDLRDHGGRATTLFPNRSRDPQERYRRAFAHYAALETGLSELTPKVQLLEAFEVLLELDRMRTFLRGSVTMLFEMTRLHLKESDDQVWCNLVHVLIWYVKPDVARWDILNDLVNYVALGGSAPCGPEDLMLAYTFDLVGFRDRVMPLATPERLAPLKAYVTTPAEDGLSEMESQVIIARYGLDGQPKKELEDVGRMLDRTREYIGQIEFKALRKLRHRAEVLAPLRPYAEAAPEKLRIMALERQVLELGDRLAVYEPTSHSASSAP